MIIDGHAHICTPIIKADDGDWYKKKNPDNSERLLEHMDRHGISKALLHQSHSPEEADILEAAVKRYPDRFMAFCGWGSKVGMTGKEAADVIEIRLQKPQFKGVGEILLYSLRGAKGFEATIQDVMREMRLVMDVVAAHKVPIIFHTGFSGAHSGRAGTPVMWKDPIYLDELAGAYRETPIIIGHSGGQYAPYDQNAIIVAFNRDNVFLDTSKSRSDVIEKAVWEIGSSRILFGSDWNTGEPLPLGPRSEKPTHLYETNLRVVRESKISDQDKENIFHKNITSLLRL
jgi:predicted TIM-barrel fold metal-dependent hydrolase